MISNAIVQSKTTRRLGDGYKDQNPDDEMANSTSSIEAARQKVQGGPMILQTNWQAANQKKGGGKNALWFRSGH